MSILNPNSLTPAIRQALKDSGLNEKPRNLKSNLESLLEDSGLSPEKTLEEVARLMVFAEQENTRLAAAKISLQLNRILSDDDVKAVPIVNIIINDSEYAQINPILIPR
jgi:hypothetical protein